MLLLGQDSMSCMDPTGGTAAVGGRGVMESRRAGRTRRDGIRIANMLLLLMVRLGRIVLVIPSL